MLNPKVDFYQGVERRHNDKCIEAKQKNRIHDVRKDPFDLQVPEKMGCESNQDTNQSVKKRN